jgi:hypothetical protein
MQQKSRLYSRPCDENSQQTTKRRGAKTNSIAVLLTRPIDESLAVVNNKTMDCPEEKDINST